MESDDSKTRRREALFARTRQVPDDAVAWHALGVSHVMDDAFLAAQSCFQTAVGLCPTYAEAWRSLAQLMDGMNRPRDAGRAARKADLFVPTHTGGRICPSITERVYAWRDRSKEGRLRAQCGWDFEAAASEDVLRLAQFLIDRRRWEEAQTFADWVTRRDDGHGAAALTLLSEIFERRRERAKAAQAACRAVAIAAPAQQPALRALAVHTLRAAGQWEQAAQHQDKLAAQALTGIPVNPFIAVQQGWSTKMLVKACRQFADTIKSATSTQHPSTRPYPRPTDRPIRLGYVSADFHDHATARLIAGMIECHDRAAFTVYGYGTGPDDGSALRARLKQGFDVFRDVAQHDDVALVQQIQADQVDVLVDLKGCTDGGRPHVFAARPAPVQIAYLGFPGPSGVPGIDATIADAVLVPDDEVDLYQEAIIRLPSSYQINDDQRARPACIARREAGLPDDAIVLANFGEAVKITTDVLAIWFDVLRRCANAVLWLQDPGDEVRDRLLKLAPDLADRIFFAPVMDQHAHLARLACADLFVDTFHCTAHTNASDALWMDVPVLTCRGVNFADRVASSLLIDLGIDKKLVCPDKHSYAQRLTELTSDRTQLAGLKAQVAASRAGSRLFDTAVRTLELEAAYRQAWAQWQHLGNLASFDVS